MAEQVSNTSAVIFSINAMFQLCPHDMARFVKGEAQWHNVNIAEVEVVEFDYTHGSNIVIRFAEKPTYLALYKFIHFIFAKYWDFEPVMSTNELKSEVLYDTIQEFLHNAVIQKRFAA